MSGPVTWQFEDQEDQVWRILNRGLRWFWVEAVEVPDRWQPGDVAVLWPWSAQGGDGVAAVITNYVYLEDADGEPVGVVASIGEPMSARGVDECDVPEPVGRPGEPVPDGPTPMGVADVWDACTREWLTRGDLYAAKDEGRDPMAANPYRKADTE